MILPSADLAGKIKPAVFRPLVALGGAVLLTVSARVHAAPDASTNIGDTVYFQGNQSQGVNWPVDASVPARLAVTNLTQDIFPALFTSTPGIQMTGSDQDRNLTLNFDGSRSIFTFGQNAYGIHVQNSGGFAGNYLQVTNFISYATNVVNGTNVTVTVTNLYGVSGPSAFTTNVTLVQAGGVTVVNHGNITTFGNGSHGIFAEVPYGTITFDFFGGGGITLPYGPGGPVNVINTGDIVTHGNDSQGIVAQSRGGVNSRALDATVSSTGDITTSGNNSHGIFALSLGGNGSGGSSGLFGGSSGGPGGDAGNVFVSGSGDIITSRDNSHGILAISQAGNGGGGGSAYVGGGGGGGGSAGKGGNVTVNGSWNITTYGTNSIGISANSAGGNGGGGGGGGFFGGTGGSGGSTGEGGTVQVISRGNIHTFGAESYGIFAESIGGFAGNGGSTSIGVFYAAGGNGGSAGDGGTVNVTNSGSITTEGKDAHAIFAESVGGGGGSAGSGNGLFALGGDGDAGGAGGRVTVTNSGTLIVNGRNARGIYAQSVGGGGGDGGDSGGLGSVGGSGSSTSYGGKVDVANTGSITSRGQAIFAQSIGGGGGSGGSSKGWIAVGGNGGGGGNGAVVTVNNSGDLHTRDANASGIHAQSIGGGGGNGGNSIAAGLYVATAIGGAGGKGGSSDVVNVTSGTNSIFTEGNQSHGIFAQSVGGGGGSGGYAAAVAVGDEAAAAFGVGGKGGDGGNGTNVTVSSQSSITTHGTNSHGIFAQSVGGGGGSGGFSIAIAASTGPALSFSMGGDGGGGGNGGIVNVTSSGEIVTTNEHAYGILAQSVGGGGGDGGFSVAGALSTGIAVPLSFGGSGATGGVGRAVSVLSSSGITTLGNDSHGIMAQSVGGGGGSGGFSVSGAISGGGALGASFGGSGDGGGNADKVTLTSTGDITTWGNHSYGLLAQSVGGGGGDGGFSVAGTISENPAIGLSLGGSGAGGGAGGAVIVTNQGFISTHGVDAHGLFAQSLGGGGGSGGFSVAGTIGGGPSAGLSLGGSGGGGGHGDTVKVDNTGNIFTASNHSYGLLAQSIGGGGGDGGFSVAADIGKGPGLAFSMGGAGGSGNYGSSVNVRNTGNILTFGETSYGLFAQSVGGGGGSGGFSVSGQLSSEGGGAAVSIGGAGGPGVDGGTVTVDNTGDVQTTNTGSHAIFVQSVGGGGGAGGFAGSLRGGLKDGASLSVAVGGSGGGGGSAGSVTLTNFGSLITRADAANGIFAQSVGGGGGDGGFALSAAFGLGQKSINAAVAIGGSGSTGGVASAVLVDNRNQIITLGSNAHGIFAQSVGGGGGNGGFAAAGTLSTSTNSKQLSVSIGGGGGSGNHGGQVTVNNTTNIATFGQDSLGIFAQSIGGGGGNGGMSFAGTFSVGASKSASLSLGGDGAGGGNGDLVQVNSSGIIETTGDSSQGIFAQSVGGGGGRGGLSIAANLGISAPSNTAYQVGVSIGGDGGAGGTGGNVFVHSTTNIITHGNDSQAILAQSIGGGGGAGGASLAGTVDLNANQGKSIVGNFSVGGNGGDGNNGGVVGVAHSGVIDTSGDGSHGVFAQSVGGGGGSAGSARSVALFIKTPSGGQTNAGKNKSFNLSIGGDGGGSSSGGKVTVTNLGNIITRGGDAYGIFAQSVGGGGGSGGDAHEGVDFQGSELIQKFISAKSDDFVVSVGGHGGSSGNGDHVTVNQTGDIATLGAGSYGILAQSVGGGGGVGGNGEVGFSGQVGVGGGAGSAGDGGDVDVIMNGNIMTWGIGAHAIFAQSIGGGGGIAGNVERGLQSIGLNVGIGLAFGQGGGNAGNGGTVTIHSTGNILTTNAGASGIFAQSIGGGGGVAGDLGNDYPGVSLLNFAGSVGGAGSGGAVNITHTGNIMTLGTNSHGIYAQSGGGTNLGGLVTIALTGNVIASGFGADGIFAQSRGDLGASDISITFTNGMIQGGNGAAAVRIADGANNTLNNFGILTTLDDLAGTNLVGTTGDDRIVNHATVIGSVDLGTGLNTFSNLSGAWFNAGKMINLGAGNSLVNAGTLLLGSNSLPQITTLHGNFLQVTGADWRVKLASPSAYDSLSISGTATVDGQLSVLRYNNFLPKKADQFTILAATNGVTGQFAGLDDPLLGQYAIRLGFIYASNHVDLVVLQDSFLQFATTGNQRSLARNINSFSGLGTTGGDAREAALLDYLNTLPGSFVPYVLDLLSPEEYGALFASSFGSAGVYSGNIEQRMDDFRRGIGGGGRLALSGSRGPILYAALEPEREPSVLSDAGHPLFAEVEDWNLFATGSGQLLDVNGTANASGYDITTAGMTLGADHRVSESFAWGFNAGYVGTEASLAQGGRADVNGAKFGVNATWFNEGSYLNGIASGGHNLYDTRRAAVGGVARGDTQGNEANALIGGGHDFWWGRLVAGPIASVRYTFVGVDGFTETGSLAPLHVEDNTSQSLLSRIGARVGYEWHAGDVIIFPELRLAWQHEYLDTSVAIDSRFASGAGSVFQVQSPTIGRNNLSLGAGLNVQFTRQMQAYLYYNGEMGGANYLANSIYGGLSFLF